MGLDGAWFRPGLGDTGGMVTGDDNAGQPHGEVPGQEGVIAGDAAETRTAPSRSRGPGIAMVLGIILIVLGLSCLGWMGYQYYGTNGPSKEAAASEINQLEKEWTGGGAQTPAPGPGAVSGSQSPAPGSASGSQSPAPQTPTYSEAQLDKAMAILRIPALGDTYRVPIITGVSDNALSRGVGWYPTTAQPGQVGNFALAGHRVTHGEPFARLLELKPGDQVIVETKTHIFTYQLDQAPSQVTVKDVDTWVLDPVPGKKDAQPTQALITLTTCQDLFRSPDRSVGFGHLIDAKQK